MLQPNDDEFFMKRALDEAKEAFKEGEIPIGAVVVCQNQIIARAHNQTEKLLDVTAHAEMIAITAAANQLGGKYLKECTIFVTVEPCPMCAAALNWSQIDRIVWGADDDKRGFHLYTPNVLHPKTSISKGTLDQECSLLMKQFFQKRR